MHFNDETNFQWHYNTSNKIILVHVAPFVAEILDPPCHQWSLCKNSEEKDYLSARTRTFLYSCSMFARLSWHLAPLGGFKAVTRSVRRFGTRWHIQLGSDDTIFFLLTANKSSTGRACFGLQALASLLFPQSRYIFWNIDVWDEHYGCRRDRLHWVI